MSDELKPCPFCGGPLDDIIKEERRKAKTETYDFLVNTGMILILSFLALVGLVNWLLL